MGTRLQIVAALAVVGSVAGGGVALAHVPAVQQTAATTSQPSDASGPTLQSLLEQSAKLHAAIESARAGLAQAGADRAASSNTQVSPDLSALEPSEQRDAPANSTPSTASRPVVTAPATPFSGDDGAEARGQDDGHEAHSTHQENPQPAPTGTHASRGDDD